MMINLKKKHFQGQEFDEPTNCPLALACKEALNDESARVGHSSVKTSNGRFNLLTPYYRSSWEMDVIKASNLTNDEDIVRTVETEDTAIHLKQYE